MKNSKILPFGDWFKVYEKAGSNFNKTQIMLESQIFEAAGAELPGAGRELKSNMQTALAGTKWEKKRAAALAYINDNKSNSEVAAAIDEVKKLDKIDGNLYNTAFVGSTPETLLAGWIASYSLKTDMKVKTVCQERLRSFSIERDSEFDIKLTPSGTGTIRTIGRVVGTYSNVVQREGESSASLYKRLKQYINQFNLIQYAGGGRDEYNKDSIEDGYFNLEVASGNPGVGNFPVYVAGTYERATAERGENTTEREEGAVAGTSGQADIQFEVGKAEIKETEASKIEALANVIIESFEGKTIDSFELKASASPEYGAIKNEQGWESNYASTSGKGDPGAGTDDASKNIKLAYDRGVAFMNALNTKLNAMGHPGFANFVINWQIAAEGGPSGNGRFVDLQLESNGKKPKIVKKTTVTGQELKAATKTSGVEEATLYYYQVNFV